MISFVMGIFTPQTPGNCADSQTSVVARKSIPALPGPDLLNTTNITQKNAFSETGKIDTKIIEWSQNANYWYALFNCSKTCIATALLLETGKQKKISIIPIITRSRNILDNAIISEIKPFLNNDRTFAFYTGSREDLAGLMYALGPKTHAIVNGSLNKFAGHLFNYVLNSDNKECNFVVIDSYGRRYQEKAKNPDEYFKLFKENSHHSIIFYNKSEEEKLQLDEDRNFLDFA